LRYRYNARSKIHLGAFLFGQGIRFVALLDESNPFVQDLPDHAAKSMGEGAHFVLLSERTDGHLPALANIRDQVRREWGNATRIEATDKFY